MRKALAVTMVFGVCSTMLSAQGELHQLFSFENNCERLRAPECMTDRRRPIRQVSGNLQEFQAAIGELSHLTRRWSFTKGLLRADSKLLNTLRGQSMTCTSGQSTGRSGHEPSGAF